MREVCFDFWKSKLTNGADEINSRTSEEDRSIYHFVPNLRYPTANGLLLRAFVEYWRFRHCPLTYVLTGQILSTDSSRTISLVLSFASKLDLAYCQTSFLHALHWRAIIARTNYFGRQNLNRIQYKNSWRTHFILTTNATLLMPSWACESTHDVTS